MSRPRALAVCAATAGLVIGTAATAAAAEPILPLSDVTAGMVGEARTVVRGTDIVTFPVTVIDVQRSAEGPGGSLILVRASGPLIDETGGVAEGMSGSPVYVTGDDGVPRVMGAVAYGSGDQANVIVGVTPIEQMLDSGSGLRANAVAPAAAPVRRAVVVRSRAAARALEARRPDRIGLYPLARWTAAGVSRPLVGPLTASLARSGIRLTSLGPRTPRPAVTLVPGASMTVLLSGGDLVIGAVGTVTYVDGATVLGFGHPFLNAGRARFLLGDGYVYQTIAAPITGSSYKLAEPGTIQGMITADRADGITARRGAADGITAVATATDAARGTESTVRTTIAPDERTVPLVAGLLQDEPAIRVRDGVAGGTLTLRIAITSPDLAKPIVYRNVYASAGDVVSMASGQLPRMLSVLMQNGVRPVPVSSISVTQRLETRVRAARILGASVRRQGASGRPTLVLRLQPWRSSPRIVTVPVRLPAGVSASSPTIRVIPESQGGFDPFPADLSQSLGGSAALGARPAVVQRAERLAARATGTRLTRVVSSLARITDDRNDAVRLLAPGEDADDPDAGVSVPVPYVVYGGRATARVPFR